MAKKNHLVFAFILLLSVAVRAQNWKDVSAEYGSLPGGLKVFKTTETISNRPFIAYYAEVDLQDKSLIPSVDTTQGRRLTPQGFYLKNSKALLVVNGTFFDFATNRNLNAVVKKGRLVSFNVHDQFVKGKDSGYAHSTRSALGVYKDRTVDVAWLFTDSTSKRASAFQQPPLLWRDKDQKASLMGFEKQYKQRSAKWKVEFAIGGGPVLLQNGDVMITNNEERMFSGKAKFDLHPRTAMGYTRDGKLIVLAVEGRNKDIAEGASLVDLATILKNLGCVEALNLDGGGSSCLLINGKETIRPSDKEGQRAVPAVFLIHSK